MSTMADAKRKRPRRTFTDEFKANAVRLVLDEGKKEEREILKKAAAFFAKERR